MPAYKQTSLLPPWCVQALAECPEANTGVHQWLLPTFNKLRHEVSIGRAIELVTNAVIRNAGAARVDAREILKAAEKSYATKGILASPGTSQKWPKPDLALIERITTEGASDWSVLNELWQLSPEKPDEDPGTTDVIIRRLFPAGSLICPGAAAESTGTYPLAELKNLHRFQFVVPSPMSTLVGRTDNGNGHESGRCLDNTGPRRFLVNDFDFKKEVNGKRTKYASLIERWEALGMSIQDATASIIMHLAQYGPLVMVVFSGGESLHAWWWCRGEPEGLSSRLHNFMRYAAKLGADPATYTRSQFVRMPGAIRSNTGRKQTVHYYDPSLIT
jgi:hypothetical protein